MTYLFVSILSWVNVSLMALIFLLALYNTIAYLVLLRISKPLILLIYMTIFLCAGLEFTRCLILNTASFHCGNPEQMPLLCSMTELSREALILIVVMTAYQLTISLQLICEDFQVQGKRKRKKWLWIISIVSFVTRVIVELIVRRW